MPSLRFLAGLLLGDSLHAQTPAPTVANAPYGKHARQVLDLYQA